MSVEHAEITNSSDVVPMSQIYVFYARSANLYYVASDQQGGWFEEKKVPETGSGASPCPIMVNDNIYCFHEGHAGNRELWYKVLDGDWRNDRQVPKTNISWSVSAVVFKDFVYCFHQDAQAQGGLWYNYCSIHNTDEWASDVAVTGSGLSYTPSVVRFKDHIYCYYHGKGEDGKLHGRIFDGTKWSQEVVISSERDMSFSPSVVLFKDALYCFHQGPNNNGYMYYRYMSNESGWSDIFRIPGVLMSNSPSVVCDATRIYCFYRSIDGAEGVKFVSFDGEKWSAPKKIVGVTIDGSPGAVVINR